MTGKHHKQDKQEQAAGFMQRWSQRKLDAQSLLDESLTDEKNLPVSELKDTADIVAKTDADMIPLDQLTEESDFSDFLSPKVSATLRKHALRKLFHMPFLNVVDGLDDYAEDFTNFEPLGDIITHEMKRMMAREKLKAEEKAKQEQLKEELRLAEANPNDLDDNGSATTVTESADDFKKTPLSATSPEQELAQQEMNNPTDDGENEELN